MASGGGGGQSGVTRYDWNPTMQGYWEGLLQNGNTTRLEGWQPYGVSDYLLRGYENQTGRNRNTFTQDEYNKLSQDPNNLGAERVANFNDDQYIGMQRVRDAANGFSMVDGKRVEINPEVRDARIAAQQLSGGALTNPYAGENPYFKKMVSDANADTTNAYNQGTSAELTRLMNMSGAFGGSAHQNAMANNQAALAKQLGNQTTSMYGQQYDKSAGLAENVMNRQLSAIPLAYQAQSLTNDMNDRLLGIGQMQQGQTQKQMDDQYSRWAEKQNFGRNNIDWFANLLGRAQGSTGVTSQSPAYAPTNYLSQGLGLGLLGRSAGLF